MAILIELKTLLEINEKEFRRIRSIYTQRFERERENESKKQQTQKPSYSSSQRAIRLSCEIIGVSEHASMDEIKKAYRSLVKIHHPDRFATDTKEQQGIAEERFIEIQQAYEILEKFK